MRRALLCVLLLMLAVMGEAQNTHVGAMLDLTQSFTGVNTFTQGVNLGPVTFSQLASLAGVTNSVIVSDGTAGSSPCTGSGTGAMASYYNGQWNCGSGGASGVTGTGTALTVPGWATSSSLRNSPCSFTVSTIYYSSYVCTVTNSTALNPYFNLLAITGGSGQIAWDLNDESGVGHTNSDFIYAALVGNGSTVFSGVTIGLAQNNVLTVQGNPTGSSPVTAMQLTGNGLLTLRGQIRTTAATFSSIGSCTSGVEGLIAAVVDSTTSTWGATITGSGSNHVLAYCDGSAWTVAAK